MCFHFIRTDSLQVVGHRCATSFSRSDDIESNVRGSWNSPRCSINGHRCCSMQNHEGMTNFSFGFYLTLVKLLHLFISFYLTSDSFSRKTENAIIKLLKFRLILFLFFIRFWCGHDTDLLLIWINTKSVRNFIVAIRFCQNLNNFNLFTKIYIQIINAYLLYIFFYSLLIWFCECFPFSRQSRWNRKAPLSINSSKKSFF